jgi:hypothetical protein
LRPIRQLIDQAMKRLDWLFNRIYAEGGRQCRRVEQAQRFHRYADGGSGAARLDPPYRAGYVDLFNQ